MFLVALEDTLKKRKTAEDQLQFLAADLGESAAKEFLSITNLVAIDFSLASIELIEQKLLVVKGQVTLWGLYHHPFILEINEQACFTCYAANLPPLWHLYDAFPISEEDKKKLQIQYTPHCLLFTNTVQSRQQPAGNWLKGINVLGEANLTYALKNLQLLYNNHTSISLQSLIKPVDKLFDIQFFTGVNTATTIVLPNWQLKIGTGTPGIVTSQLQNGPLQLPVHIDIPPFNDPLDELALRLQERIALKDAYVKDEDLAPRTVYESLGVRELHLTNGVVERKGATLVLTGTAGLFELSLPSKHTWTFSLSSDNKLEYALAIELPNKWDATTLFPLTKFTFFEELLWKQLLYNTVENSIQVGEPYRVEKGWSVHVQINKDEGLNELQVLNEQFTAFNMIGRMKPANIGRFELEFTRTFSKDLTASLTGIVPFTMKAPLTLQLGIDNASIRAYIEGNVDMQPLPSFTGQLQLPLAGTNLEVYTLKSKHEIAQKNIVSSFLQLSKDAANDFVPASLLNAAALTMKEFQVDFTKELRSNTHTTALLVPSKEAGTFEWSPYPSSPIKLNGFNWTYKRGFNLLEAGAPLEYVMGATFSGKMAIGNTHDLDVSLDMPFEGDWEFVLTDPSKQPTLTDLAMLLWNSTTAKQDEIMKSLPSNLIDTKATAPGIKLAAVKVGFNPTLQQGGPYLSYGSVEISQTAPWKPLGTDALKLDGWKAIIKVDVKNGNAVSGKIEGQVVIANQGPLQIHMPIPAQQDGWTMQLIEGQQISFPGMGHFLQLLHGQDLQLPQKFHAFGAFDITKLYVKVDPTKPSVNEFLLAFQSKTNWVFIEDLLDVKVNNASIEMKRINDVCHFYGTIKGEINFGEATVNMIVQKHGEQPWYTSFWLSEAIELPGLESLAKWMFPDQSLQYVVPSFMPFKKGIELNKLGMVLSSDKGLLQSISFGVRNLDSWDILSGYLSLQAVDVSMDIAKEKDVFGIHEAHIKALWDIAGTQFLFTADKAKVTAPWILKGKLIKQEALALEKILGALQHFEHTQLPKLDSLPNIALTDWETTIIPEEGFFHMKGDINTPWKIQLGSMSLQMLSVGGEITVKRSQEEEFSYAATVTGRLKIQSLQALMGVSLGNGDTPIIFTGHLTAEEAKAVTLPALSNEFVPTAWEVQTPAGMTGFQLNTASVYLNPSDKVFYLHGKFSFGDQPGDLETLFYAEEVPGKTVEEKVTNQFIFAGQLGEHFTFEKLWPDAKVIDQFIQLKSVYTWFNSHDIADVNALKKKFTTIPAALQHNIPTDKFQTAGIAAGWHVYGALDFSTDLLKTYLQLSKLKDAPLVQAYGDITKDPAKRIFRAQFAPFSFWDTITFGNKTTGEMLQFEYKAADGGSYSIAGPLGIKLFQENYQFDGALTINTKTATFKTSMPSTKPIDAPFGLTKVKLASAALQVDYSFATVEKKEADINISLSAAIKVGENATFDVMLKCRQVNPVLLKISLKGQFTVGQLFNYFIQTPQWPTTVFDIGLKDGALTYYKKANDTNNNIGESGLEDGLNLQTQLILFIKKEYLLNITAHINDKGLLGRASLPEKIDFGILQIAGAKDNGRDPYKDGPSLFINTQQDKPTIGLEAGINLFNYPLGVATVEVQKDGHGQQKLHAQLQTKPVEHWGNFTLGFSYSKQQGLAIDKWPNWKFTGANDVFNFIKVIQDIMALTGFCEFAVNTATSTLVNTKFDVSPSVRVGEHGLELVLAGKYIICTIGGAEITTLDFPAEFIVQLPSDTHFDSVYDACVKVIVDSAAHFVAELFKEPVKLGIFVMSVFGPIIGGEIIARLLCMGLGSLILPTFFTISDGVIVILPVILTPGHLPKLNPGVRIEPPVFDYHTYENGKLIVTWHPASYANQYPVNLKLGDNNSLLHEILPFNKRNIEYQVNRETLPAGTLTFSVASKYGDVISKPNEFTIQKLPPVKALKLVHVEASGECIITWSHDNVGQTADIQLYKGTSLVKDLKLQKSPLVIAIKDMESGDYNVSAVANAAGMIESSTVKTSYVISKLSKPTELQAKGMVDSIEFTWKNVNDSDEYEIQIWDGEKSIHQASTYNKQYVYPIKTGGSFTATVRNVGQRIGEPSAWTAHSNMVAYLPPPKVTRFDFDSNTHSLVTTWEPVPGAVEYELQIVTINEKMFIVHAIDMDGGSFGYHLNVDALPYVPSYQVRLRSKGTGNINSSVFIIHEQSVMRLANMPFFNGMVAVDGKHINLAMSPINDTTTYRIELIEHSTPQPKIIDKRIIENKPPIQFPADLLALIEVPYTFKCYPVKAGWIDGVPHESEIIRRKAAPTIMKAAVNLNTLYVELEMNAPRNSYQMFLTGPENTTHLFVDPPGELYIGALKAGTYDIHVVITSSTYNIGSESSNTVTIELNPILLDDEARFIATNKIHPEAAFKRLKATFPYESFLNIMTALHHAKYPMGNALWGLIATYKSINQLTAAAYLDIVNKVYEDEVAIIVARSTFDKDVPANVAAEKLVVYMNNVTSPIVIITALVAAGYPGKDAAAALRGLKGFINEPIIDDIIQWLIAGR
ncbi:hypothetical protein [Chitinophaga skermanii]|nr:hypothetical protein [Chitinophaga skermanii]